MVLCPTNPTRFFLWGTALMGQGIEGKRLMQPCPTNPTNPTLYKLRNTKCVCVLTSEQHTHISRVYESLCSETVGHVGHGGLKP
jgi:hypothetical protein